MDTLTYFRVTESLFRQGIYHHLDWEGDPDKGWAPEKESNPGAAVHIFSRVHPVPCEYCGQLIWKAKEGVHFEEECRANPNLAGTPFIKGLGATPLIKGIPQPIEPWAESYPEPGDQSVDQSNEESDEEAVDEPPESYGVFLARKLKEAQRRDQQKARTLEIANHAKQDPRAFNAFDPVFKKMMLLPVTLIQKDNEEFRNWRYEEPDFEELMKDSKKEED